MSEQTPRYVPTPEELESDSWAACYGQTVITVLIVTPPSEEPVHEHH